MIWIEETVMIRQGKGKKDRVIPIGDRALAWVAKYLDEARYQFAIEPDEGFLFLTHKGELITTNRFTQMVRDYVKAAEIDKVGSCHLFRHSMATLMLENGADIRFYTSYARPCKDRDYRDLYSSEHSQA